MQIAQEKGKDMDAFRKAQDEVKNHYPMPAVVRQAVQLLNYDLWQGPIESAIAMYGSDGDVEPTVVTFYENLTGETWSNSFAQIPCPKCGHKEKEITTIVGIPTNPTTEDLWSIVSVWLDTMPSTVYVDLDGDCCMCDRAEDFCYCDDMQDYGDDGRDADGEPMQCAYCDGDMSVYEVNVAEAILPSEVYKQYV